MTSIKKAYTGIVGILEAALAENPKAKVADVIEAVRAEASAKTTRAGGSTFIKDVEGNVVAVSCYYFKRWMPLVGEKAVEFGKKANTVTGLNTMCKEGTSHWTKQQAEARKAEVSMIDKLKSGELATTDIDAEKARIEEQRKRIEPTELGFAEEAEVRAYLEQSGVKLAA